MPSPSSRNPQPMAGGAAWGAAPGRARAEVPEGCRWPDLNFPGILGCSVPSCKGHCFVPRALGMESHVLMFCWCFFFFLALGVFFLPTRLAVFCRLLLWAGASRGDVWASRPRASCCWLPLGQVSLGETEAREGIQATSPKSLGGNGRSAARARAPGTSPRTRGWARCCCPPWIPPTLWLCVLGDRASPWLLLCPSGCCCVRSRRLSTSGTWPPRLAGIPSPLTTTRCA